MPDAAAKLVKLKVELLDPHPDNPRIALREDVIAGIVANLDGEYPQKHALIVRPLNGRYQILSGHQRFEAARRKGLTHVWAWSEEMDDDAAFMLLVTSNAQGELAPLEYGLHALKAVPKAKGGRGKTGGLSEYAEKIGRSQQYVTQIRQAAEVVSGSGIPTSQLVGFLVKAQHLAALHRLPRVAWADACAWLAEADASVADVEERVSRAIEFRKEFDPMEWREYLPPDLAMAAVFAGRTDAAEFRKLLSIAREFHARLVAAVHELEKRYAKIDADLRPEVPKLHREWEAWLVDNRGKTSWSSREVRRKRDELEDRLAELIDRDPADDYLLIEGDFRTAKIKPGTADWIVTDPPYPKKFVELFRDLGAFAARALKPGGAMLVMVGQSYLPEVIAALGESLKYQWVIAYLTPGGQAVQVWDRKVNTSWKPVLLYRKDDFDGDWFGDVTRSDVNDNDKRFHNWGQSESGMYDLMERFVSPGQLVIDPCLGGGTTGVVCLGIRARFVGIDLDAKAIQTTADRLESVKGNLKERRKHGRSQKK